MSDDERCHPGCRTSGYQGARRVRRMALELC